MKWQTYADDKDMHIKMSVFLCHFSIEIFNEEHKSLQVW